MMRPEFPSELSLPWTRCVCQASLTTNETELATGDGDHQSERGEAGGERFRYYDLHLFFRSLLKAN